MGIAADVPLGQQRRLRLHRGCWAAVVALTLLITAACTSDPAGDASVDAAGQSGDEVPGQTDGDAGREEPTGGSAPLPTEPVDVEAALSRFEPPGQSSGLPPADPAHCAGADPDHVLSIFPAATEFQAASMIPEPPDAAEDEVFTQCRMSFEVLLLDDECTVMEVRDVTFDSAVVDTHDAHEGSLTTTSVLTYFSGRAQKPGIVLDYRLSAGCEETSDLSDLEDEFRGIWVRHRDQFIETPPYGRP